MFSQSLAARIPGLGLFTNCGRDIQSKFLFDGLAYDSEYFRQKMIKLRRHKTEQRERIRKLLAESRSGDLLLGAVDLATSPGLLDALDGLPMGLPTSVETYSRDEFDLKRYEAHLQAHTQDFPVNLRDYHP